MRDMNKLRDSRDVAPKTDKAPGLSAKNLLASVAVAALLAGCSSVPDAVNPVEWYKGVRDAISSDDKKSEEKSATETDKKDEAPNRLVSDRNKPAPGAEESFPKLSSVPDRPKTSSTEERKELKEGLVADRDGAKRYSSEVIRRQGEAASPLPAPPPAVKLPESPPVAKVQPAPRMQTKVEKKSAPVTTPQPAMTPAPTMRPAPQPVTQKMPDRTPSGQLLAVVPQQPKVMIPRVNPEAPQMAAVPGYETLTSGGAMETVVISGGGVQTYPARPGNVRRSQRRIAPGIRRGNSKGTRSLSEFNPSQVNGSYQVATIVFGNGSAHVKSRARKVLRQVVSQQRKVGGTIRVVGHASSRTRALDIVRHKMVNFKVSVARADAVAKELMRLGVKANSLYVGAVSDSQPKYMEYMPTGEAGNRRTEIYIDF